jgi:hypothetical protein
MVNTDPIIEFSVHLILIGKKLTFQFVTKILIFGLNLLKNAFCEEFTLWEALLNFYYLFNKVQVKKVQLQPVYRILIWM